VVCGGLTAPIMSRMGMRQVQVNVSTSARTYGIAVVVQLEHYDMI
jgi:hypothetical protein